MFGLGPTELIIILIIVIVLFGAGRIGKLGGELGTGIRAFREGIQTKDEEKGEEKADEESASGDKT